MKELISIVVPVYNRPEELRELLQSLTTLEGGDPFEIVIIEDGSQRDAGELVAEFKESLPISYHFKENTGPGDSRNFGMRKAKGKYLVLVDSDCILPRDYLTVLRNYLTQNPVDCVGGRDAAHPDFSYLQKAVSYSMTSWLTTGGIRGGNRPDKNFQPRSFNMALSRTAFETSGGFSRIHPGEDPDLSLRLKKLGFKTAYIPQWYVYHKRRINWSAFYRQVYRFGLARPILNRWHPGTAKLSYWFPTVFSIGLGIAIVLAFLGLTDLLKEEILRVLIWVPIIIYALYFTLIFSGAWRSAGSFRIGLLAIIASFIQFLGYGWGFLKSQMLLNFSAKEPDMLFPNLFFKS